MIYMTFSDILRLIYNLLRIRQVSLTALKVPLNLWSNFPYDFVYMKKNLGKVVIFVLCLLIIILFFT